MDTCKNTSAYIWPQHGAKVHNRKVCTSNKYTYVHFDRWTGHAPESAYTCTTN